MTDPIEEFLVGYSPDMQAVSRTLRAMVKHAMPQANEVLFARDNHFAYGMSESMRDRIVYICPMRDYVRLGFMYGGFLPDPEGMLVGTGKRLRHVKVRTLQGADDPAIERLLEAAWADAPGRVRKKP